MNFYLYYAIIIPMRRTRMIQFNIDVFYINSHLDRGRNSAWSWREARLCFTKTRKHTEANQRRPSEARPPWILSAAWPRLQLTTQRRNMSSDWSEYPRVECCLYHPLSLSPGYRTAEIICSKLWTTSRWISGWRPSTGKLRDWRRAPASLRLCRPAPTRKMNPSEDRSSLLRKSKKSLFLLPTFTDGYGSSSFPSNNLNSDSSGVDIQLLFCSRVCLINRSLRTNRHD